MKIRSLIIKEDGYVVENFINQRNIWKKFNTKPLNLTTV